mmetsp:Transcript_6471/g.10893  ORF Transcript_6471/g.10893 Transcript_6471/m.10893 type:complete len:84 (-) Transcript_6471:118-369(-)
MPDGTLSGSALTMMQAVRNCVTHCHISLEEAVAMATTVPARVLGVQDCKGSIAIGYDADLCVFDENYEVLVTILGGKCVHNVL